ncbi:MAG: hypothetical protein Q4F05_01645 [bacterium]|nr:hypothetical protein [bacterium]
MQVNGYLDFHTHILPGVDDGSKDMEMTKAMLMKAYEEGVRTILATSHHYPGRTKQDPEKRRDLVKQVDEIAKQISPDMKVLQGNEIYYRESIVEELENGTVLPLADTKYVLVEFNPNEHYRRIYEGISELIQSGYYPVIAHVERVGTLIGSRSHMKELIEMSCYMQANSGSFMGGFFDKQSKTLLALMKENMIHFIGSDCHNLTSRPPRMEACVKKLYKKLPKETVDQVLIYNQERFLQNKFL